MEHRREPMGGEVDSDQVIGSDWTNNNDTVDSSNQSMESVSNDNFVDHLTLKVRSLLSNWDECEPQANAPATLKGKQPKNDSRQLFDVGTTSHSSTASNKGNSGAPVGGEIPTRNQTANPNKPSKDTSLGFKRQGPSRFFDHLANPEDLLLMNNSVSQSNQLPKILINENEQASHDFEACSHSTAKVGTCLSYDDFSNTLQDLKDKAKHKRQQEFEEPDYSCQHDEVKHNIQQELEKPSYSGQRKPSLKKSFIFAGDLKTNPNQNYFLNPSKHLDVRHESLENEAERSWSEITVRAESFMQPFEVSTRESQKSLSEQDLVHLSFQGTSSLTSGKDGTTRHIGVNAITSNTVSLNPNDPSIKYNYSLADTPRIVVGSNLTSSNASLNPVVLNTNKDSLATDSRSKVGVASGSASPVGFNFRTKGGIDRRFKKSASNNESLSTLDFNAATNSRINAGVASGSAFPVEFNSKGGIGRSPSTDSRFNAGVASGSASPVETNSKGGTGRRPSNNESLSTLDFNAATDSRFNAGVASGSASPVEFNSKGGIGTHSLKSNSKNKAVNPVNFNSDQDALASNSRSKAIDLASNNAPMNLIDFNTAHANSVTRGFNAAANNASLNPAGFNTGYGDNLFIAFRPGLVNSGNNEAPNLMDFDTVSKDNLMSFPRTASGVGFSASSRASMDDWRINLFDPSRNPLRDPEHNYNSSDFDATERETPPLSASSMASSRRLEWDNGADIGYSIAILNPNIHGVVPEMARGDPEGISLMNETLNVGPSPISTFPYFSFRSGGSSANFATGSSQASSTGDVDNDLVDRSSSLGSLSRSDSKKSVIYNSVRDMRRQSKSLSSKANSSCLGQPFTNFSCPNLTDLRNSLTNRDWAKDNFSKSEEQVGAGKALKTFLFPSLTTQRMHNVYCNRSRNVGQQSSSGMEEVYDKGDMLVSRQESLQNVPHACKTCQAPLSLVGDQTNLTSSKSQNAAEEGAFQYDPDEVEYNPVYDNDQVVDWVSETSNLASDPQYIDRFSDDYPHPRPILVVSNNSSKLKGGNLSKIVGSFFDNNAGTLDLSTCGHSDVKPHIRWYPFAPTSTPQDIKDVSTQTAVSFVAQQLKETPVQAVFEQQTSSPEDITIELPGRLGFLEPRAFTGAAVQEEDVDVRNIFGVSTPESQAKPTNITVAEVSHPDLSVLSTRLLNLESGSSLDSQDHVENRMSNRQNPFQTCRSCHTDINVAADGPLFSSRDERHQTLIASRRSPLCTENLSSADNNSTVDLEHSTFSMNGRLSGVTSTSYSSPGDLTNPAVPRGERKLGVGECQRMPSVIQRDSSSSTTGLEGNRLRKDSVTALLPCSALQPFTPSDSSTRRNTTSHESAPSENPSNVRNLVGALNRSNTATQRNSENAAIGSFQFNSVVNTTISALDTFHDSIGSRTTIPGGNVTHSASGNRISDSTKFTSVSQSNFPAASTNLLDFLSQNRPFSDSKYLEQKEGIPKSFSDPLIAVHDQDESSEEDGGLVTFMSHAYEGFSGDSRLDHQHDHRQTPDVVYQQNPNITPPADSFYSDHSQNHILNRILPPNQDKKGSIDSERRFVGGGHFQVSQSTSAIDDPGKLTKKQNRSRPGQLGSSSLLSQRDISHGLEDARLLRATQSTWSSGDSFSNDVNSARNQGGHGDTEFGQCTRLNFQQTLENARRGDNAANVANPPLQMKGVAQTQSKINTTHFFPQLQENAERACRSQLSPPLSTLNDARNNEVNVNAENNTRKYSPKKVSQFGEVPGIRNQTMQQPNNATGRIVDSRNDNVNYSTKQNNNVQVQTQSDIGDRSTSSNHLQFLEDSHRQSQARPRINSKSLSSMMNNDGQNRTNTPIEIATHESPAVRDRNICDNNKSHSRQQPNEDTTKILDITTSSTVKYAHDFSAGRPGKVSNSSQSLAKQQLNEDSARLVDVSDNNLKNGNLTVKYGIGEKSCRIQDDASKQIPPRSGSNSYPSPTRWDSDYTRRNPLVANRNFVSVGIQASGQPLLELEKCTFCHQSRSSHLNHCPQRDKFKVALGQALERGRRGAMCGRSGTSFCVFSKVCFCCCNKTLQEAFNFHRAEIVERIEARQKEAETRTGKSFFLNLAPPAATHQKNSKQRLKPVAVKPASTSRPHSNKENIKNNARHYPAPTSNSSKQKCRLKNLTKYNRVMSKIYSQRLKNEILKGKVNFSRHEILMNS